MNFEGTIIQLERLSAEAKTETLKLQPGTIPDRGSHAYGELARKMARWEQQADLIAKRLRSAASLADLRYRANRFGPGAYAARQSYNASRSKADKQAAAEARLAQAMTELKTKLDGPQSPEHARMKALSHALENIAKALEQGVAAQPQDLRLVDIEVGKLSGSPMSIPHFTPGAISGALTLAVYVLVMIKMKLDGRTR